VRLADFIVANVEPILAEWELFARGIWPEAGAADPTEMRDEAEDILRATVVDMLSQQTAAQQAEKSKGASRQSNEDDDLTRASSSHGRRREVSGFELWAVIAEYRALRASVLRLWRASKPTPDRPPPVRLDGVHVLVVDDQADARRVLTMVLERAGAVVTTADSARTAIETFLKARPDVLVSDLGMPDQDGFDLIRQLRDDGHDARVLPAVALTAFVQKDDAHLALLAGFQVHLPKPVDEHDLTSVISRLAGRTS
jgi:CheY-like chemotaxis protein